MICKIDLSNIAKHHFLRQDQDHIFFHGRRPIHSPYSASNPVLKKKRANQRQFVFDLLVASPASARKNRL